MNDIHTNKKFVIHDRKHKINKKSYVSVIGYHGIHNNGNTHADVFNP